MVPGLDGIFDVHVAGDLVFTKAMLGRYPEPDDVMHVVQVPLLLGRGVRLWDGVEGVEARYDIEAVSSPSGVTHLTFTRR